MFGLFGQKGVTFDPARDIPDLAGKVILVTGGNSGLGAETVHQLAQHNPKTIYLTARNPSSADAVIARAKETAPNANIKVLQLDLSSFASVKKAAKTFLAEAQRLDVLMLNAGVAHPPAALTAEGYEWHFGVNHMGHALLTQLLMPRILETASASGGSDVRVVVLASNAPNMLSRTFQIPDLDALVKSPAKEPEMASSFTRYGLSKLANIYFAQGLAREYPAVKCVSVHPGMVDTDVVRWAVQTWMWPLVKVAMLFSNTVQLGAKGQLWAGFTKDRNSVKDGALYLPIGIEGVRGSWEVHSLMFDKSMERKFWEYTERELKGRGFGNWP